MPSEILSVSIDYSDDELDAVSEAFTRRDIARRERAEQPNDPVWRAQSQTALRGLMARRAIVLGGTRARPRMTFLEPHATLLGAYLGAEAVATIRREQPASMRAVSLFAHGDIVVEQRAREGMAIQQMTAHGRDAAPAMLRGELSLPEPVAAPSTGAIELTARTMMLAVTAIERREAAPEGVPSRVADILFARRASGSVTLTSRDRSGTRAAGHWSWIDAGELGLWNVQADESTPLVRLTPADAGELAAEIDATWCAALSA